LSTFLIHSQTATADQPSPLKPAAAAAAAAATAPVSALPSSPAQHTELENQKTVDALKRRVAYLERRLKQEIDRNVELQEMRIVAPDSQLHCDIVTWDVFLDPPRNSIRNIETRTDHAVAKQSRDRYTQHCWLSQCAMYSLPARSITTSFKSAILRRSLGSPPNGRPESRRRQNIIEGSRERVVKCVYTQHSAWYLIISVCERLYNCQKAFAETLSHFLGLLLSFLSL
jgi:hypothetical protein